VPNSGALLETNKPTISPKRPRTELKISITRILTNLHTGQCPCPSRYTFRKGDVQRGIGSIGKRSTTTIDANGDTTDEIAHADGQAGPEQGIASVVAVTRVRSLSLQGVQLGREYDGHDDAVNGHDLTEDDRDKVLGTDTWGLDAAAQD